MLTAIAFIVTIGILVVWHEMGHYLAARWCGVHVIRFSFGFGRVLYKWQAKPGSTEWTLSLIPLGGYVAMQDESTPVPAGTNPPPVARSLNSQPLFKRAFIVAAGPLSNFLLAILIYWGMAVFGSREPAAILAAAPAGSVLHAAGLTAPVLVTAIDDQTVASYEQLSLRLSQAAISRSQVTLLSAAPDALGRDESVATQQLLLDFSGLTNAQLEGNFLPRLGLYLAPPQALIELVLPDSPAERAGLQPKDRILRINDADQANAAAVVAAVRSAAGRELTLEIVRDNQVRTVVLRPQTDAKGQTKIGIGFAPVPQVLVQNGPLDAVGVAFAKTWDLSIFSLKMLGQIITGQAALSNLSGPLTIADVAGKSASLGLDRFVAFLALVSIGLGVLNLLPIPMLDGGHLLYYAAEALTGKPPSATLMAAGQMLGAALLAVLMTVALTNDVLRLFLN